MGIGIAYGGGRTYSVVRFASSPNKSALGVSVGNFETASSPGVNKVRVTGWALDPDSKGSSVVDVKVNGVVVASQPANVAQTDVGAAHKGYGNNHGFNVTATTVGGSTKSVCVEARNLAGHGGTVSLGCKNVAVKPDLSGPFYDVSSVHPFEAEIAWLEAEGITGGFSDGTFRPTSAVTREGLAAFLWRYMGKPAPAANAPRFTDVPTTHPFSTAIRWMAGEKITSGFSDGTFRGNQAVTRQAAASFLWKLQGSRPPAPGARSFRDVPSTHTFHTAIRWLAGAGLTTGHADGTFRPSATLTRQAIASYLYNYDRL